MIERKGEIPDLDFAAAVGDLFRVKADGRTGQYVARIGDTICVRLDGATECFTATEVEEVDR